MCSTRFYVHRLVGEYYVPNPHNYLQINHLDGNKTNNHYTNLEWCTNAQNQSHAVQLGLTMIRLGELHMNAKLKEHEAQFILDNKGIIKSKDLANQFNVARITINKIWSRDIWKHLV